MRDSMDKVRHCLICAALVSLSATASDLHHGQLVYNGTCIACHGSDGTGGLPGVPDLTGKTGLLSQDDAILLGRMADGFQTPGSSMAMPPKGGNPALTDADLKAVLKYMRNEFQQDPQTRRKTQ
ncbi:cytochrome c [Thiobacillus sp.]|uniref:c-type cytochrome n=1 Tax=Thiobacillus sp. TaxID=924 RepID=UPI0025EC32D6|nr:cytochrome c [Thiobacillus sp.]